MKNALIILIIVAAAIAAVVVCGVLLFSGPDTEETPLEPLDRPPVGGDPAGEPDDEPIAPPPPDRPSGDRPAEVDLEDVEPTTRWKWKQVDVAVRVVDLKSLKTVSNDKLEWRIFRNDLLLPLEPSPGGKRGVLTFGALIPSRYRFEVDCEDGRMGSLTLQVEPYLGYSEEIYVGHPAPLELKVVRAGKGTPVADAQVDVQGIISRGTTDAEGAIRSKRPVIPDGSLEVKVSKPGYLTAIHKPFARETVRSRGRVRGKIALSPLTGATHLSGTLSDQNGNPLQSFSLRLFPSGSGTDDAETDRFYETSTTHSGEFTFKNLAPGTYVLEGLMRHWVLPSQTRLPSLFRESVVIEPGDARKDMRIVCTLSQLRIKGIVLQAETMQPVPGVRVSWNGTRSGPTYEKLSFADAVSNANGIFTIARPYMPADVHALLMSQGLQLTAPDMPRTVYRVAQSSGSISEIIGCLMQGTPIPVWIHGRNTIELEGSVTDFDGNPIKRVQVNARPMVHSGTVIIRAITTQKGNFKIPNLYPGEWEVLAALPSGPTLRRLITLPPNAEPEPVDFRADGSGRIEGSVDLETAPYYPRLTIRGEGFVLENVRLRQSGNFTLEHLPPGEAEIIVESHSSQELDEKSLVIRTGRVTIVNGQTVAAKL